MLPWTFLSAQTISDLINLVSPTGVEQMVRDISGEDPVLVGGNSVTIDHRVSNWGNDLAANFLVEQFQSYGLSVSDDSYSAGGRNIYATQVGVVNPNDIYIICAHYDAVGYYGADDNASATAAVLEAARIMSNYQFENTVIFALWDEEETGLNGATAFATAAASNNDNILGVVNMDMIGYDGDNDHVVDIDVRNIANSLQIKDDLINVINTHNLNLTPNVVNPGTLDSDHAAFWDQGYSALLVGEEWSGWDITPGYHTNSNDRISLFNMSYFVEMVKLSVGYITTKAVPYTSCSPTFSNIIVSACGSYTSPSGNIKSSSIIFNDTISNVSGCDSVITIDLTITPLPNTNVVLNSNTLTADLFADAYQWVDCDNSLAHISNENNQSFSPQQSGNFAVIITNNGCTDTSECQAISISTAGLSELNMTSRIYPNPSTGIISIDYGNFNVQEVFIYNQMGQLVRELPAESITHNLSNLANGIYFIHLQNDDAIETFKIQLVHK